MFGAFDLVQQFTVSHIDRRPLPLWRRGRGFFLLGGQFRIQGIHRLLRGQDGLVIPEYPPGYREIPFPVVHFRLGQLDRLSRQIPPAKNMQSRPAGRYLGIAAEPFHPGGRPRVYLSCLVVNAVVEIHPHDSAAVEHETHTGYIPGCGDLLLWIRRIRPFTASGLANLCRRFPAGAPGFRVVCPGPPQGIRVDRHFIRLPFLGVVQEHEANPLPGSLQFLRYLVMVRQWIHRPLPEYTSSPP